MHRSLNLGRFDFIFCQFVIWFHFSFFLLNLSLILIIKSIEKWREKWEEKHTLTLTLNRTIILNFRHLISLDYHLVLSFLFFGHSWNELWACQSEMILVESKNTDARTSRWRIYWFFSVIPRKYAISIVIYSNFLHYFQTD